MHLPDWLIDMFGCEHCRYGDVCEKAGYDLDEFLDSGKRWQDFKAMKEEQARKEKEEKVKQEKEWEEKGLHWRKYIDKQDDKAN